MSLGARAGAALTDSSTDLKALTLANLQDDATVVGPLAFNPNKLHLSSMGVHSVPLLKVLSQQSCITSLSLSDLTSTWRQLLPLVQQQLVTLKVSMDEGLPKDFLRQATGLKNLVFDASRIRTLDSAPRSLESLEFWHNEQADMQPVLELLDSEVVGVAGLQHLTLRPYHIGDSGFYRDDSSWGRSCNGTG
jgi:hypothetical protein